MVEHTLLFRYTSPKFQTKRKKQHITSDCCKSSFDMCTCPFENSCRIRGRLGTFMVLSTMLGTLIGYIIGAFFGSLMISAFGLVMAVFFIIWMSFIPETPIYLCIHNKTDAAQISLKYYHHDLTVEELCKSKDSSKTTGITWTDICK